MTASSSSKPILCVDFDGVIHSYTSGWKGAAIIPDSPVPGALAWLHSASRLFDVVIYSSRSKDPEGITAMRLWLVYHARSELPGGAALDLLNAITFAHEKPSAFLTIDDRAICFEGDWTHASLDPASLLAFQPWNKRAEPAHAPGAPGGSETAPTMEPRTHALPSPGTAGNGAHAALVRYLGRYLAAHTLGAINADHLLVWLWREGFKVVPLDGGELGTGTD